MKKSLILFFAFFAFSLSAQTVTKDSSVVIDNGNAYYQITYKEYSDTSFQTTSTRLGTREQAEALYFNQITTTAGLYAQNARVLLGQRSLISELLRFGATFPGDLGVDVMAAIWATEADLTATGVWLLRKEGADRGITFSVSGSSLMWEYAAVGDKYVAGFLGSIFFLSNCDGYNRILYKVGTDAYQTADGEYSLRKTGVTAPKSAIIIDTNDVRELNVDGTVTLRGVHYKYSNTGTKKRPNWQWVKI